MHKVCVRRDSGSDLAGPELVEESYILAKYSSEILFADLLGDVFPSVDEAHGTYVNRDVFANGQVNEIERKVRQFSIEVMLGQRTVEEVLKYTSKLTKDNLEPISRRRKRLVTFAVADLRS